MSATSLAPAPNTYTNYDAERRLLAVLVKEAKLIPKAMERASETWFYDTDHRKLYAALCDVYREHGVLSATRIYAKLRGEAYAQVLLKALNADFAVPEELPHLLDVLELCHRRRRWYEVGEAIRAMSAAEDVEDAIYLDTEAQALVYNALEQRQSGEFRPLADGVLQVIEEMEAAKAGKPTPRVKVGLPSVDEATQGLTPGEFVILAGVPGMGKSACALSMSLRIARRGGGVLYYSPEMAMRQLARRTIQVEGPVGREAFGEDPSEEHIRRAREVYGQLKGKPLYIMDHRGLTVERVVASARSMVLQHPEIEVIIIDHFGELRKPREFYRSGNSALILGDMILALATMGRQLNVPVILLHQLNKIADDKRISNKRPTPGDLRDTGRAREIADQIWLLYRHAKYADCGEDSKLAGMTELIIGKNRNGVETTCYLWFDEQFMAYRDALPSLIEPYKQWAGGGKA